MNLLDEGLFTFHWIWNLTANCTEFDWPIEWTIFHFIFIFSEVHHLESILDAFDHDGLGRSRPSSVELINISVQFLGILGIIAHAFFDINFQYIVSSLFCRRAAIAEITLCHIPLLVELFNYSLLWKLIRLGIVLDAEVCLGLWILDYVISSRLLNDRLVLWARWRTRKLRQRSLSPRATRINFWLVGSASRCSGGRALAILIYPSLFFFDLYIEYLRVAFNAWRWIIVDVRVHRACAFNIRFMLFRCQFIIAIIRSFFHALM